MPCDVCFQTQYWEGRDGVESLFSQTRLRLSMETHKHLHAYKRTHMKVNEHMQKYIITNITWFGKLNSQGIPS